MKKHLRHETNCLNCGATIEERYCSRCGQENIETKESFIHLASHFFEDVTHYDSKFFLTIKDLIFKPGFLTKEYLLGRRARYLHPVRTYIFVSFLYFLVAFAFTHSSHRLEEATAERAAHAAKKDIADSLRYIVATAGSTTPVDSIKKVTLSNTMHRLKLDSIHEEEIEFQLIGNIDYKYLKAYDAAQRALPERQRDKGLKPWIYGRWLAGINHYGEAVVELIVEKTQHAIPKLMFVLLPLFALLMKLFYNRKKYFYMDHAIFSLHFHCAVFLFFFIVTLLHKIVPALSVYLTLLEMILVIAYLAVALKNTYGQSLLRSVLKALGLTVLYGAFIVFGFVALGLSALL